MKLPLYLQYLIQSEIVTLNALAEASGIDKSDLSKVVNGKRPCGGKTIQQLLPALPESQQKTALQYWLMDQIPEGFENLVKVGLVKPDAKVKEERGDVRTLSGALASLEKEAEGNPHVRIVLMNMAQAFAPPAS